ncbi:MAG: hypothetical protein GY754_42140 [bacterium]|nr:hypothetical protein [bacterium]
MKKIGLCFVIFIITLIFISCDVPGSVNYAATIDHELELPESFWNNPPEFIAKIKNDQTQPQGTGCIMLATVKNGILLAARFGFNWRPHYMVITNFKKTEANSHVNFKSIDIGKFHLSKDKRNIIKVSEISTELKSGQKLLNESAPPLLNKWITEIELLMKKHGITYYDARFINEDPRVSPFLKDFMNNAGNFTIEKSDLIQ